MRFAKFPNNLLKISLLLTQLSYREAMCSGRIHKKLLIIEMEKGKNELRTQMQNCCCEFLFYRKFNKQNHVE